MHDVYDIGDEVTTLDHRRTGCVMDLMVDDSLMVLWDDEPFCRLVRPEQVQRPSYVTMVHNPRQRRTLLRTIAFAVSAGVLVSAVAWMSAPAKAANLVTRSDCTEARHHPESSTADRCRAAGWTVRPRLVVGPRGVVQFSALPHCRYEDGSGQRSACSWNFTSGDGNSRGLTLWNDRHDHSHYVWPVSPVASNVGPPLHWVSSGLADALAEGGSRYATTRRWEQCVVQYGHTTTVVCPDGHREVS